MAPARRSELYLRVATAAWIICLLYNVHTTLAAPLPQAEAAAAGGSKSGTNTTLIDPFSTPDYLGNLTQRARTLCLTNASVHSILS